MQENEVTLVIPCYNEGMNIDFLHTELVKLFTNIRENIEIIFIDDGSTDETLTTMKEVAIKSIFKIRIISFSRNFGKEAAIYAGLKESRGKYTVIIDADLQQNPKYIFEMKKILDDNPDIDQVAAYPAHRKENAFKAFVKKRIYNFMKLTDIELKESVCDFRIFRRNVLEAVLAMSEKHRFSKGIFAWIGFSTYYYPYQVEKRVIGKSKWNYKSLFTYLIEGLADYSKKPLLYSIYIGILFIIVSIIAFIATLAMKVFVTNTVSGLIWIALLLVFLCGIILVSNGILGYYLSKTLTEVKNRPIYIVKKRFENEAIPVTVEELQKNNDTKNETSNIEIAYDEKSLDEDNTGDTKDKENEDDGE